MQDKEAPPEDMPPTSDVPPAALDDPHTFSGTSWLDWNDMIRDVLTKGMLPDDVSGTATNPFPAWLQSNQGEPSLRQIADTRKNSAMHH